MASSDRNVGRRDFIRDAAALAATVSAARAARAASEPWRVLQPGQAVAIEALGDTILPGASAAGLAHFLDAQLAKPPERALLTLRYLDVAPPYAGFYAGAAAALDAASRHAHAADFATLAEGERERIVKAMGADAAASVANGFGQAHDHENLFLAGAGLFPTSGAVNPTFTVCALALRTADYIIRNWSSLA